MRIQPLLLLSLLLSACLSPGGNTTMTPAPTLPPTASATASPAPSATAEPTAPPSATPIPYLMYPYTLRGLREHAYHGGEIRIRAALGLTNDYTSYLVDYPSDGLTISGVLQIPHGEGPFPVIVMNHGFFKRGEYASGDGTRRAAEVLNRSGYITIAPDYRSWGSSDTGYSFFQAGLVIDVINLLQAVPSIPKADPQRIGMWGHSMGGGVTTKVLAVDGRVRAAVLYAPNSADDADLIERWGLGCIGDISSGELREDCNSADIIPGSLPPELIQAYREAAADPLLLEAMAPIHHLEWFAAPVQIHIGEADGQYIGATPPAWSRKLYEALLAAGKPVEYYTYPGQGHSFTGEDWQTFMHRAVAFFDRYVKE